MSYSPQYNPYQPSQVSHFGPGQREMPHSGLGIISLLIGVLAVVMDFIVFVMSAMSLNSEGVSTLDETSSAAMVIGLLAIFAWFLNFMGAVLGLIGLFQSERKLMMAFCGLVLNGLVGIGMLGVLLLGLSMG